MRKAFVVQFPELGGTALAKHAYENKKRTDKEYTRPVYADFLKAVLENRKLFETFSILEENWDHGSFEIALRAFHTDVYEKEGL